MTNPTGPDHRLVFVTGPSGAGRTTAIRVLEDLGYEGIDNIPLSLVPRLIDGVPLGRPIVLGLDPRNRDFNPNALIELIDSLTRTSDSVNALLDEGNRAALKETLASLALVSRTLAELGTADRVHAGRADGAPRDRAGRWSGWGVRAGGDPPGVHRDGG